MDDAEDCSTRCIPENVKYRHIIVNKRAAPTRTTDQLFVSRDGLPDRLNRLDRLYA